MSQEDFNDDISERGDSQHIQYLQLKAKSRLLLNEGKVKEALEVTRKMFSIKQSDRLKGKIEKMEEYLKNEEESETEEDTDMVEVKNGFYLYKDIYHKLYEYQKEGIAWMWQLFKLKKGGILGDDMGLGKTIQVISFLSGMYDAELIKSVMIVMPVSLITNWTKEFEKWAPGIRIYEFHSSSKKERERNLLRVQKKSGVILTSYGMVLSNAEIMGSCDGRYFVWDYLILDEGHKIKNPTKTTKAIHEMPARNRIVLTGTPIQNNLGELWSLYNFTHQGTLLGSRQTFKLQYENPILKSREKDATSADRMLGTEMSENLRKIIQPFFLRRTKAGVLQEKKEKDKKNEKSSNSLSRKNDLVVWLYLSNAQEQIYRDFLELDQVQMILMTKKSPLVQLTMLKKICDHPRLLSKRACIQLGLNQDLENKDIDELLDNDDGMAMCIDNVPEETLIEESGKLKFLVELVENLRSEGHRALIFSQSRKMLDIIQTVLNSRNFKMTRMDGTVRKLIDREKLIRQFQGDSSFEIFLLTTQVGGVGLTLTAADRVIIYDPSWNPASDAQAVDRVYRIGQNKNVVVYRLITCSTVEEKIYRRQIFKDSITKQATGHQKDPHRYFTKQELRELFSLENPRVSTTQLQLQEMHSHKRITDTELDCHIAFLYSIDIFGISDHDLMFSEEFATDDDPAVEAEREFVKKRVEMAYKMVQVESDVAVSELAKRTDFTMPYLLSIRNKQNSNNESNRPNLFPINIPDVLDDVKTNNWVNNDFVKVIPVEDEREDEIKSEIPTEYMKSLNKSFQSFTIVDSDDEKSPKEVVPMNKSDSIFVIQSEPSSIMDDESMDPSGIIEETDESDGEQLPEKNSESTSSSPKKVLRNFEDALEMLQKSQEEDQNCEEHDRSLGSQSSLILDDYAKTKNEIPYPQQNLSSTAQASYELKTAKIEEAENTEILKKSRFSRSVRHSLGDSLASDMKILAVDAVKPGSKQEASENVSFDDITKDLKRSSKCDAESNQTIEKDKENVSENMSFEDVIKALSQSIEEEVESRETAVKTPENIRHSEFSGYNSHRLYETPGDAVFTPLQQMGDKKRLHSSPYTPQSLQMMPKQKIMALSPSLTGLQKEEPPASQSFSKLNLVLPVSPLKRITPLRVSSFNSTSMGKAEVSSFQAALALSQEITPPEAPQPREKTGQFNRRKSTGSHIQSQLKDLTESLESSFEETEEEGEVAVNIKRNLSMDSEHGVDESDESIIHKKNFKKRAIIISDEEITDDDDEEVFPPGKKNTSYLSTVSRSYGDTSVEGSDYINESNFEDSEEEPEQTIDEETTDSEE